MCKAFVIQRATEQDKAEMTRIVAEMNDEQAFVAPGESSAFTLRGNEIDEVITYRSGETYDITWGFVKTECGAVAQIHGEEEEMHCPGCRELMEVGSRFRGEVNTVLSY